MSGKIDARLAELGITLPAPAAPVASYVPYVEAGNLVIISGQITMENGEIRYPGKLGAEVSLEDGYQAARLCAVNLLAQLKVACDGDLDRVQRVMRLGGFVACTADFSDHPKVINGASDLMAEVFGDAGKHARAAVGAPSLPLNVSVEVEGMFLIS
ncbi:MAG: RidA family protein [Rhodospirillales bacterium]|nr:RidA family protein [Rhodospirillales bacterium]